MDEEKVKTKAKLKIALKGIDQVLENSFLFFDRRTIIRELKKVRMAINSVEEIYEKEFGDDR